MACRGCFECLLKLLNFLLTLVGLAMVGYGIYLLVEWKRVSDVPDISPASDNHEFVELGRPLLMVVSLSANIFEKLPKAWFIYLFIAIGVILFVISCFGCIGVATRTGCCLTCYSVLVILLILAELGCAAFIFFDKSWRDALPTDRTGDFDSIYSFLKDNWKIAKWVALGAVILEALLFFLALIVRAGNSPSDYDSDEEYLAQRSAIRQQLIPSAGAPVAGTLDQRPIKNDSWSTRMREKSNVWKEAKRKPHPTCVVCGGSGRVDCLYCQGRGRTNCVHLVMLPKGEWPKWCKTCGGSGLDYCSRCNGTGEYRDRMGFHFMKLDSHQEKVVKRDSNRSLPID